MNVMAGCWRACRWQIRGGNHRTIFLVALTKVAATDVNLKGLRMARRVGKSRK
jgi:hypothetical protein